MSKIESFNQKQLKTDLPELRPGYTVKVYQKIFEGGKERIQAFEGMILARKHGKGINATITVRKISDGIGVERVFPLHSPLIQKIEAIKKTKVRRAKLYYIRKLKSKKIRLTAISELETKTDKKESKSDLPTEPELKEK